ncbi:peptidoglycan bridge formation glycyltransferase FemA/FemB family protein [Treponema sp. OttesenSCG-928-L16]|nr:peptidoglycan bridge formation glycyltransferase FemA/FemB family protein [Treponema sp. OttesenSCG-928-L16]
MNIDVIPKPAIFLEETKLLQQTGYWSFVKGDLGWDPLAFDITVSGHKIGDVLILRKDLGGVSMAYAPYGPEYFPVDELEGVYLVNLSRALSQYLGPSCIFIRWDIPWESPYAEEPELYNEKGDWMGPPATALMELRMNWGVEDVGLRKAPSDFLPPDTVLLDIRQDEDEIMERMHPKTRYNIRLADRKGVRVRKGDAADLPVWNSLYTETAKRNRIVPHGQEYFMPLLEKQEAPESGIEEENSDVPVSVELLIAEADETPLAAMFMSVSGGRATYLYGASSDSQRNYMAAYALQWEAILKAREAGCSSYDLFGVSPTADPVHPMYGLYRFKKGFGGQMLHRQGAWDYPFDENAYTQFRTREFTDPGFNV